MFRSLNIQQLNPLPQWNCSKTTGNQHHCYWGWGSGGPAPENFWNLRCSQVNSDAFSGSCSGSWTFSNWTLPHTELSRQQETNITLITVIGEGGGGGSRGPRPEKFLNLTCSHLLTHNICVYKLHFIHIFYSMDIAHAKSNPFKKWGNLFWWNFIISCKSKFTYWWLQKQSTNYIYYYYRTQPRAGVTINIAYTLASSRVSNLPTCNFLKHIVRASIGLYIWLKYYYYYYYYYN